MEMFDLRSHRFEGLMVLDRDLEFRVPVNRGVCSLLALFLSSLGILRCLLVFQRSRVSSLIDLVDLLVLCLG